MKALSGRLHMHGDLKREGEIMFNGDPMDSGAFHVPKVVTYVDEV